MSAAYEYNLTSTLGPDTEYTPYDQRPETYIVPILFFIIFVVGVLGNGTLVIIFLRHRAMRNVPNTYIFSLALADLLVILTCVPFTSIIYTLESWPWGVIICKINESVKDISIGVSVFTLTALSAERYCAIVNPLRRLQTKPLTVISAGMIWILATGFALPDAICSGLYYAQIGDNKTIAYCSPWPNITNVETYMKYAIVLKSLIYYFIPLGIIAFFYVLMAIRLHQSANEMPGEIRGVQIFFICFLPHHVFMLWFHLYPDSKEEYNDWWHALKIIGFCLSFLNSCVNPVALYCVSGVFRGHFNRYLCCKDPRWPRNTLSQANCETSFNSTYRRNTQNTTVETQSLYRKNTLARKNTEEANFLTNHKKADIPEVGFRNTMILRTQMDFEKGGYGS
ncbi:unnamed protein product [Callosobruchus maculatus]|uniref:G-protein coupled receptors family 1 profile domain-containing protein n=1 Tax=Callosobruchus maculatus TaxID=64391 RepID=A0A653BLW7_CALMS|nr:unnamed protein product [Callosobruchus maculatus]